ncbi:hypothetical protein GCM10008904_00430 [Paraclostridium ghonii]|uniref:Crystaline entomocidal protoxin n=1 Tax=Paraclostridium ghonii TaxID=29358 RepID=A0ABU0MY67_9FIRM|nr:insecticidal delta-endotoxin Cry8Ea1 family protein [Paeniclostridium ghonii]MDQ0555854.1 hypothetical protein [Paeniclostridium ghonii]
MEQNYEQSNSTQTIQPFSAPSGVSTTISITATLLGMISGPAGGTLSIFGTIVNLLWPTSPGNQNVTWNDMMNYTAELVNQKLSEYAVQSAESELNGLKSSIETYRDAVKIFTKNVEVYGYSNPITAQSQATLISIISGVHQQFVNRITAAFTTNGYKTALLPGYASVATLHLLYLREIVIDHKKLGLDDQDFKYYTNQLYKKVKEYSDYCINTYNDGLNSQKQRGWSYFNKYRREMTLLVLDLIALFSNYDPNNYNPIYDQNKDIETFDVNLYSMETKTELTREIYSDVLNNDIKNIISTDHNTNENRFIPKPNLFEWLQEIKCVRRNYRNSNNNLYQFLSGHQLRTCYTPRGFQSFWGQFFGEDTSYPGTTVSYINMQPQSCKSINIESYHVLGINPLPPGWAQDLALDKVNITKMKFELTIGALSFGGDVSYTIRRNTVSNENNILSYMASYSQNETSHGYIFGFTHNSVDHDNVIAADKITQIPAVKGCELYRSNVVKGPCYTGGDIVDLYNPYEYQPNWDGVIKESRVKIDVKMQKSKRYKVRLYYASTSNTRLKLNDTVFTLDKTIDSYSDLANYGKLKHVDIGYVTGSNSTYSTIVLNKYEQDSTHVYLSKVEFIPE